MNSLQFLSEQVDKVISRSSKASQRLGDGGEGVARTHSLVDMSKEDTDELDSRKRPLIELSSLSLLCLFIRGRRARRFRELTR